MTQAIARLSEMADLVLFNAPPLSLYSDAAILASRLDGVLLVVEAGKTRRDSAQKARDTLNRACARLRRRDAGPELNAGAVLPLLFLNRYTL